MTDLLRCLRFVSSDLPLVALGAGVLAGFAIGVWVGFVWKR